MGGVIVKLLVLVVISVFICLAGYRRKCETVGSAPIVNPKPAWREIAWFFALVVVCGGLLASLLRQSWFQHDEWVCILWSHLPLLTAVKQSILRYFSWVSRIGEIGTVVVGISPSRWQEWVLTSFFAALAPIATFLLVKKSNATLFSGKGRWFYMTAFALFLLAVYLPRWRNYWCYAASWNYLYPTVCLIYFLSFFRSDAKQRKGFFACLFAFSVGCVSGWGTECGFAVICPLLTCLVLYNLVAKTPWLPFTSYCGYCGFLWGGAAIFCSPALYLRARMVSTTKAIDISSLSASEYYDFLHNLDWDKVFLLRGATNIISLKDIPLLDRIYFLPFTGERFWECCCVVLVFWVLLSMVFLFCCKEKRKFRIFLVSVLGIGVSALAALSYAVQCIPSHMSFLPAGFAAVVACMFLFERFSNQTAMRICGSLALVAACIVFVPAGIQAAQYKDQDIARFETVYQAKQRGETDITLRKPSVTLWWPTLGLIAVDDIKSADKTGDDSFPNSYCAKHFGIHSINQPKADVRKSRYVPIWVFPEEDRKLMDEGASAE